MEPITTASPQPLPDNNRLAIRQVARGCGKAALATSLEGRPYASLVTVVLDHDLSPILLLSSLADHTRNLRVDARASLLLDGTEGHPNPQTGPRVTLMGELAEDPDPRLRRRFLARHPAAALYADFADFAVWRMRLERIHFVGGFGRAVWFDAPLISDDLAAAFAEAEEELLERLNRDHAAEIAALAVRLGGAPSKGWTLSGLDMDGCDILCESMSLRAAFPEPAEGPISAVQAVSILAGRAVE